MACPQGITYCTYWVRVPASGAPYEPPTVAPQVMAVLTTLFLLVVCFVVQHVRNLCAGKYGLSAIPLYDFLMKKWRNAPTFEPVYASRPGVY